MQAQTRCRRQQATSGDALSSLPRDPLGCPGLLESLGTGLTPPKVTHTPLLLNHFGLTHLFAHI